MYLNDGEVALRHMEMRKRDLLREARMEQLSQEASEKPEKLQRGWMRLIGDLLSRQPQTGEDVTPAPLEAPFGGLETT